VPGAPPSSELTTDILREPDSVRLILGGELDMNGVIQAERAVQDAATATALLTIDLGDLRFMDLFGARALLRVADEANTPSRRVVIVNPRRHVRRLFELITDLAHGRSLVAELVQRDQLQARPYAGDGSGPAGSAGGGSAGGCSSGSASSRERR
jgi:anti-anti-sigma factor